MKFTVSSVSLSTKLSAVGRVINSKNALPILGDIVFEIKEGVLSLTASDSEIWMQTGLDLTESGDEGAFAVGAKSITDAVKGVPEQPLSFDVDMENKTVKISYRNGHFSLPVEDASEFPRPVSIHGDIHKEIDRKLFLECVSRAQFGCDENELRPVMNGEYFDFTPDYLAIVASDGHKLIRNRILDYKSETISAFIMPKKAVALFKGTVGKDTDTVQLFFDQRNAQLTYGVNILTFRLIEGRYPNYNSVIPEDNPCKARVTRVELLGALKRVQAFANGSSNLVRFSFEESKIQLDAEDYDFSKTATETVACEYEGQPMSIGFKASTVIEVLSNLTCQEVLIQLKDPARAGIIVPAEQEENVDVVMLTMPMLLNN